MKFKTIPLIAASVSMVIGASLLASCGGRVNPYDLDFDIETRGTTIDFWTGFGTDINTTLEALLDDFEEETGIRVNYETKGSYDNLNNAITLSATTTTYPHVALGYPDHFAGYVNSDIQLRLDYYFENDKDDDFNASDFYDEYMVENMTLEYDSEGNPYILGIPFNKSTEVMTVNQSFFDWATAYDSNIFVPRTWDEVETVGGLINELLDPFIGKVMGSKDGVPTAYNSANACRNDGAVEVIDLTAVGDDEFRPIAYDSQENLFITTVRQFGAEYTSIDPSTRKGYLEFDSQKTVDGLNRLKELFDDKILGTPNFWGENKYASGPFKFCYTVMTIGSSAGVANSAPAANKFNSKCYPVPYHDASRKYVISQGTNLCLLDRGSVAERVAAWKLVKYLSKEVHGEFAAATGYFPSCEYAQNSEAYQDFINRTDGSDVEKLKRSAASVNTEFYTEESEDWIKFVDAPFIGSADVRNEVGTITNMLFFSNPPMTPQEIINNKYRILSDYVRASQ